MFLKCTAFPCLSESLHRCDLYYVDKCDVNLLSIARQSQDLDSEAVFNCILQSHIRFVGTFHLFLDCFGRLLIFFFFKNLTV